MDEFDIEKCILDYKEATDALQKIEIGSELCNYYLHSVYDFELMRKHAFELYDISTNIKNNEMRMRFLQFIGISYTMEGDHQSAKSYFEEALSIAILMNNDFLIAMAYMNVGTTEHYKGNLYNALNTYLKALNTYETIIDSDGLHQEALVSGKVQIYTNIGVLFNQVNNPKEALIWCKKALRMKSQSTNPMICYYIGGCYTKIKDYALALGYFRRAIKYSKEDTDIYYHIASHVSMAHIYIERAKYEEAEFLLRRSFNFYEQNKMNDIVLEISGMLAEIYCHRKQYDMAEQHFQTGLEIVPQIQNENILKDFFVSYSNYNKEIGNISEAYNYLQKAYLLKSKLCDDDIHRTTTFLAAKVESEQK